METEVNTLESIMQYEIDEILKSPVSTVFFDIDITIHTPKKDIKVLYPESLGRLKDYVNRYSDLVNIACAIPLGTLIHEIFPYKEELEITLKLIPLRSTTTYEKYEAGVIRQTRYIAKLTEQSSKLAEGNSDVMTSRKLGDESQISSVSFQLVGKSAHDIKEFTVGFIARKVIPMDVILFALTAYSKEIVTDSGEAIKGVTIAPGYDKKEREHVIIPQLTRLVDLPNNINRSCGGLYPTGFSYYLDEAFWFVYPMFDVKRYATSDDTLTIINVPKNRLPGTEKTFRLTPTQLIIISTGEVKHQDEFEYKKGSIGNAVRFVDAKKVQEDFGKKELNKFIPSKPLNTTESAMGADDPNPVHQHVTETTTKVTGAPNHEYSRLAEQAGSRIMVTWENSNDSLLIPGMPVRYMFLANGQARQLYGTLLAAETSMVPTNNTPTKKRLTSTTVLSCFVERDITQTKQQ